MVHTDLIPQPALSVKDLLATLEWVDGFNGKQIETVAPYFAAYKATAGTAILKEGNSHDFFALICEGSVDVIKQDHTGNPKTILSISRGKAFGEIAFFDEGICSANVVAKTENLLLVMDKHNFAELAEHHPPLALTIMLKIIKTISQRLRQTTGRLVDSM